MSVSSGPTPIGNQLKFFCGLRGISITELSERIKINKIAMEALLENKYVCTEERKKEIADILDISLAVLDNKEKLKMGEKEINDLGRFTKEVVEENLKRLLQDWFKKE